MSEQDKQQAEGLAVTDQGDKISSDKTKTHMMDVGPGVLGVELPCGFIDSEKKLHDTLVVGEMTGWEEDILGGKGPIVPRLNQIITNCARRFGDLVERKDIANAVTNMTAADRMTALIAIRRVSLGDYYDVKIECPKCNDKSRYSLNLADIDIVRMKDQYNRVREDELTSGKRVRWHVMNSSDEEWLSKRTKKKEDVLTLAMLARVEAVDVDIKKDGNVEFFEIKREGKNYKQALEALKSLGIRDRNEIRKLFETYEGSVDTMVEFECPGCQYEWKADLDVGQPGFFFPSDI